MNGCPECGSAMPRMEDATKKYGVKVQVKKRGEWADDFESTAGYMDEFGSYPSEAEAARACREFDAIMERIGEENTRHVVMPVWEW